MDSKEQVRTERRGGLLSRLRPGEAAPRDGRRGLLQAVRTYNAKADLKEIERAYRFAESHHEGQMRKSGEPFIGHPLAVARDRSPTSASTPRRCRRRCSTTPSRTPTSRSRTSSVSSRPRSRGSWTGSPSSSRSTFRSREQEQAENVRKMIVAMSGDIRVLLIKLADRLHNMRTLAPLAPDKQQRIATETLEIYAPLAHRLGVQQIKWELEDLVVQGAASRARTARSRASSSARRGERQEYVDARPGRRADAAARGGIKADVDGRPKHLYSIYEKMVIGGKEFNEIYDLAGVRVLVESVKDVYAALGAVHSLWKPVPGRFKDYIAMPKSNMYQSLHTTVVGPAGPADRGPDPHEGDAPYRRVRDRRALALQGGRPRRAGRRRTRTSPGSARCSSG